MSDRDTGTVPDPHEPFTPEDEDDFLKADSTRHSTHNVPVDSKGPDEFDGFDLRGHFSAKQLAVVDKLSKIKGSGYIHYQQIDRYDGHPGAEFDGWLRGDKSPYDKYRMWNGFLTVSTDLAGPAWCAFKSALNLIMAGYGDDDDLHTEDEDEEPPTKKRKLEKVPSKSSQASADELRKSSKENASRTAAFNRLLEAELAKEVTAIEDIPAYSREDEWARRLVKLLLCIDHLFRFGYCKEMDIFGIIGDFVVTGKPDGVTKVSEDLRTARGMPTYPTPPPSREGSPVDDDIELEHLLEAPRDARLTNIRSIESSQAGGVPANPETVRFNGVEHGQPAGEGRRTVITIWKRKAFPNYRTSNSTEYQAAIMLMCYYRLLTDLFSPDFSFQPIWEKLGIDGSLPLSLQFLKHADKFVRLDDTLCLNDLTAEFFRRRAQMPNPVFESTMRIWYERVGNKTHDDHKVTYSRTALDAHLEDVFKWWKGEQPVKGVDAASAGRTCPSCSHNKYCLWRRSDGNTRDPPLPPEW